MLLCGWTPSHCVLAYYRTATVAAKNWECSAKWHQNIVLAALHMKSGHGNVVLFGSLWCFKCSRWHNLNGEQVVEQLATLWPQIKGLMQIIVQRRHTHRKCLHMIPTLTPLPTGAAFMKPWHWAKLAQLAWVLTAVCLHFWVLNWTVSSNNQLWHKQTKRYSSHGIVSKHLGTLIVHLGSTLDGVFYGCGLKQFYQLPEYMEIWCVL